MLLSAEKELGNINHVSNTAKERYLSKIIEILESTDVKWLHYKPDANQILKFLVEENARFAIWWTAWKKCAPQDIHDEEYTRSIAAFINDLGIAPLSVKISIKPDLYQLMELSELRISKRATQMHSYLG